MSPATCVDVRAPRCVAVKLLSVVVASPASCVAVRPRAWVAVKAVSSVVGRALSAVVDRAPIWVAARLAICWDDRLPSAVVVSVDICICDSPETVRSCRVEGARRLNCKDVRPRTWVVTSAASCVEEKFASVVWDRPAICVDCRPVCETERSWICVADRALRAVVDNDPTCAAVSAAS